MPCVLSFRNSPFASVMLLLGSRLRFWCRHMRFFSALPQASVAPRPMMPRCSSLPAPAEGTHTRRQAFFQQLASKPSNPMSPNGRSPPRSAAVAPSHGGSNACTRCIQPRSLSVPSMNTPGGNSTSTVDKTAGSVDNAWLELQREMGSLKADNRVFSRGSAGINAHSLHTCGSAVSVLTKSLAENSTVCAETTTDMIAQTLSLGLDGPAPVWKRKHLPESLPLEGISDDSNNLTTKYSERCRRRPFLVVCVREFTILVVNAIWCNLLTNYDGRKVMIE